MPTEDKLPDVDTLGECLRCGEPFQPGDFDPEVSGLAYCSLCGAPATYDR